MKKFIAVGSILVILFIALTRVSFAEGRNSPGLINEMRVHQKMYMLLLSEKFTPELTRDWEIELNRRDTLRREIFQRNKNKEPINQILENLEEIKNRLKILEEKIDKRKMPAGTEMDGEKKHPETEKPCLLYTSYHSTIVYIAFQTFLKVKFLQPLKVSNSIFASRKHYHIKLTKIFIGKNVLSFHVRLIR